MVKSLFTSRILRQVAQSLVLCYALLGGIPCRSACAESAVAPAATGVESVNVDSPMASHSAPPGPRNWLASWDSPDFWETIDGQPFARSWEISDGELRLVAPRGGNGSLLSPPVPAHFILTFQWRIAPGTNSGVKYRVRQWDHRWLGVEYQIIDEPIPLPQISTGSTASIYDLIPAALNKPLLPPGEWNTARIEAVGNRVRHYLNGVLVADSRLDDPPWQAALYRSKFFGLERFGLPADADRIMLTDHGGRAAFRDFCLVAATPCGKFAEQPPPAQSPQLGNALRNSWVDQNSITLWSRTTRHAEYVSEGPDFLDAKTNPPQKVKDADELTALQIPAGFALDDMLGACPGAPGEIRLTYFPVDQRHRMSTTAWQRTTPENDYTMQWHVDRLRPGTKYAAIVEARPIGSQEVTAVIRGHFHTAPAVATPADVRFCMTTCHDFLRRDDGLQGHRIYASMPKLAPHFLVHAGDIEYYDKPRPFAWTIDLMRFKWGRLFAMPRNRDFYANTSSYFIKDDHDTLKNDCWPGQRYGAVTFEEGVRLFNEEQFPSRDPRYMTVRWGADVQMWILEGRDYRSPNTMPDGPEKTILGTEQKRWLRETLARSDAPFKLVFTPTPIVGPDRPNKSDNHANEVFAHEGEELRKFFAATPGVILFCGDRHWQYASVDPQHGLWEFGCGPGSAEHELGWKPGDFRPEHRFLRVQGGFLYGEVRREDRRPVLIVRHYDVDGRPLSEFRFTGSSPANDQVP
ncbi:MAG: hypothetical protein KatS3mg111_3955 [Pirellulaceae bacterium]|nr:MAG: hypothetical protein KatS3mg111_3955 [Pirellulaceae bacterium]